MNIKNIALTSAAVAITGVVTLVNPAGARTVGGHSVEPLSAGVVNRCLAEWGGSVMNICPATTSVIIPLVLDNNSGGYPIAKVRTLGRAASCFMDGVPADKSTYYRSSATAVSSGVNYQVLTVSAFVPSGGQAYVFCSLPTGNELIGVDYTP